MNWAQVLGKQGVVKIKNLAVDIDYSFKIPPIIYFKKHAYPRLLF